VSIKHVRKRNWQVNGSQANDSVIHLIHPNLVTHLIRDPLTPSALCGETCRPIDLRKAPILQVLLTVCCSAAATALV